MDPNFVEYVAQDIDSLARKIVANMGGSHESILAVGSLAAASHILRGQVASQPAYRPTPKIQGAYVPADLAPANPATCMPPIPPVPNQSTRDIADIAAELAARLNRGMPHGQSQGQGQPQDEFEPEADGPQTGTSPRSLAKQWAGPLPTLNGQAPQGQGQGQTQAAQRTKAAPKIKYAKPTARCPCGDRVADHPRARNFKPDAEGHVIYVLCGEKLYYSDDVELGDDPRQEG